MVQFEERGDVIRVQDLLSNRGSLEEDNPSDGEEEVSARERKKCLSPDVPQLIVAIARQARAHKNEEESKKRGLKDENKCGSCSKSESATEK